MSEQPETPGAVTQAAPGALADRMFAELHRAHRCEMTWVMDLGSYKQVRRQQAACMPDVEQDEDRWVPSIDDRMFGLRILVRDGGGEPHIEWLTKEEQGR